MDSDIAEANGVGGHGPWAVVFDFGANFGEGYGELVAIGK
jgi:hypothetical protein